MFWSCVCVFVKHKYSWSCSPFNSGWKMTGISTTFSASLRDLVQKSQMKRKRKWRKVRNKNIKHVYFSLYYVSVNFSNRLFVSEKALELCRKLFSLSSAITTINILPFIININITILKNQQQQKHKNQHIFWPSFCLIIFLRPQSQATPWNWKGISFVNWWLIFLL